MTAAAPSYCGRIADRFGRIVYLTPRVYPTREDAIRQCFNVRLRATACSTSLAALAPDGRVIDTGEDVFRHKRRNWRRRLGV